MTVVVIVAVVLAAVIGLAMTRPDSYGIERSATIEAPAETIYALIVDFRRWPRWSPFEALDPAMKRSYSGADSGMGAIYEWEGNGRAGKGRMEIAEAAPFSGVTIEVDFVKPFSARNVNIFSFEREGNATKVVWSMRGTQPFVLKVMSLFASTDRILGKHFETGLANLRTVAEGEAGRAGPPAS